jgi:hypothetical protein
MMAGYFRADQKHHRFGNGNLVTRAKSKVKWAQIAPGGRVHFINEAIIRWNFHGGTFAKPDITYVALCGPQRHHLFPVCNPEPRDICARCDARNRWP